MDKLPLINKRAEEFLKTRKEAHQKLRDVQRQIAEGIDLSRAQMTLGKFLEKWARIECPTLSKSQDP